MKRECDYASDDNEIEAGKAVMKAYFGMAVAKQVHKRYGFPLPEGYGEISD